MKKSVLFFGCIMCVAVLFGQNKASIKSKSTISETSETPKQAKVGNERVSDYLQFEKKIIAWTTTSKIPSSTPKHKVGQSRAEYAEILLYWAKDNLSIINEKYKIKLTDEAQFQALLKKIQETK